MRVKIKGFLRNLSDNTKQGIDVPAIQTKSALSYFDQDIKNTFKYLDNKIYLIRENKDFQSTIVFDLKEDTENEYRLKEINQFLLIQVKTHFILYNEKKIQIRYEVLDSHEQFEYNIEIR